MRALAALIATVVLAGAGSASACQGGQQTTGNATTYCGHGNRVYDDESGHGLAVVPHDPTCPQSWAGGGQ